jgi:TRAP-type C4-dicarboxylate transport system permease small subunit
MEIAIKKLIKVIESLSEASGYFCGTIVILLMSLILYEVTLRYVWGKPPAIADEISAYMLVALSFIGLAYAWKKGTHVRIEFIVNRLPAKISRWLRVVLLILALAYVVLVSKIMYSFVLSQHARGMRSPSWLMVPLFIPQIAMVVGFIILSLQLIVEVFKAVKGANYFAQKESS